MGLSSFNCGHAIVTYGNAENDEMSPPDKVFAECKGCGKSLAVNHKGACPDCGHVGKKVHVHLSGAIEVSTALSVSWTKTREYYEKAPLLIVAWVTIAIASSAIGLILAGWIGVLISLVLSAAATLLGFRGLIKVREIERGSRTSQ